MTNTTSAPTDSIGSLGASTPSTQAHPEERPSMRHGRRGEKKNSEWQVSFGAAQFAVALCILGVYIASMVLMMEQRADPAPEWDRLVYLFTGFETIVFVAAGAIFGTRVQRVSVEAAQEQSRQAREDLGAERERADRAGQLEEAAVNLRKALRVAAETGPQNTGNGPAPARSPENPSHIGDRGPSGSAAPLGGTSGQNDSGLNYASGLDYAIRLAEEFFSPSRR